MHYRVASEKRPATNGLDGTVLILEDQSTGSRAEIWPALGCNCYRWLEHYNGKPVELLYAAPNLLDDLRPSRSGIPILFPFPNRIRAGVFAWHSEKYTLPRNDSPKENAIHGFACRHPWRIIDQGATDSEAWLTGEFHASRDAVDDLKFWPADHRLRVTFRLAEHRLRLSARIDNPDRVELPFGLGYHPYFRAPFGDGSPESCWVQANAGRFWELKNSLPTGSVLPVDAARDLTKPRRVSDLTLDDVLRGDAGRDTLPLLGLLRQESVGELHLRADPAFRELVVFTPAHRQAFCLEPYTCTTDAINLQPRGIDAGWQALAPGASWQGDIELQFVPAS